MMRILELMFITWLVQLQVAVAQNGGKDCRGQCCGDLPIDYPFGLINTRCSLDDTFSVNCTKGVATLPAKKGSSYTFTILQFRPPNQVLLETSKIMAVDCLNQSMSSFSFNLSISLPEPFSISARSNRFRAIGCDTAAYINNTVHNFRSQCETQWMLSSDGVKHGGLGQCQIAVPEGSPGYEYNVTNRFNYSISACWRNCSYAFLADEEYAINATVLDNYVDWSNRWVNESVRFPLVGEWVIKDGQCNKTCPTCGSPTCGTDTWCNYTSSNSGYNCYCKKDCNGNPYIRNGTGGCCKDDGPPLVLILALAGGFALAGTLGASSYAYGSWAEKKLAMKLSSKFLHELARSGDSLPPDPPVDPTDGDADHLPPHGDVDPDQGGPDDPDAGDKPRDFNQQDLKKAIKLYQKGRRVALWARRRMVARANLVKEGHVEIRKYTVQDRGQLEPFVRGVRTLSRTVNHANVARLLGISTRDSSLIYRYFSEKTLHDRLHSSRTDRPSWEERLKIAVGTARGLVLAHSKGIYHGNVKSSNILLDESCNCKVVDFGVVRVWSRNKLLNSSKGYVDPEYLKQSSNQITSTMDVYSFGVILVELITGKDPSAKAFNQRGISLTMQFTLALEEKRLHELVDNKIWAEERKDQLEAVAKVAAQCLQQEAKGRPKMMVVRDKLWKWAPELRPPTKANPGTRAANPGARTANPGARTSNPGARATNPGAGSGQGQDDNQPSQDDQGQDQFNSGFDTGENIASNAGGDDDEEDTWP